MEPDRYPVTTTMCECNHHWYVHGESGRTARSAVCFGYIGSATPGPLYDPCRCTGFRPWTGPRDSRTGEPVRPLTMFADARVQQRPDDNDAAAAAARASERQRIREYLLSVVTVNVKAGDALPLAPLLAAIRDL